MFDAQVETLLATAHHGRVGLRAFQEQLPELSDQIVRDRGSAALNLWASSLNYDENANARITDRKLLGAVGRMVRYPIRDGNTYHAGLMHTYGYMLSQQDTPYGKKHERWTSGKLESGLGLPVGVLLDLGGQSSLLQNVTSLFSTLTGNAESNSQLSHVHSSIRGYDCKGLDRQLVRETVEIQGGDKFELDTYITYFPAPNGREAGLLVYGVRAGDGPLRLVTGFPMSSESIAELLSPEKFGIARSIRPRYNAFVMGFPAGAFGTRELIG